MISTASCSSHLYPSHRKKKLSRNFHSRTVSACCNTEPVLTNDSVSITHASDDTKRRCECFDFHKELVPYNKAWQWQKSFIKKRYSMIDKEEDESDAILTLQHPSVYTLGTGSLEDHLNFDISNSPYDIYRTERGGEVTYHGPGQIVMYPIMNLRFHKMDLHWYLRSLEEVIIRAFSSTFSINASRIQGFTGVWVGNEKIAAIGIRVSKWVTYHGLAVNITTDLTPFKHIVPCGIKDKGVTSLKKLLGNNSQISKIEDELLIDLAHESLLREFSEVFQVSFEFKPASNLIAFGNDQGM